MQLHQLQRKTKQARKKIVGRGGKRGTTAGRGTKGQRARAGHRIRPALRDELKKLPKHRGYRFNSRLALRRAISLSELVGKFEANETVTPSSLVAKGLLGNLREAFKLLAVSNRPKQSAKFNLKLTIKNCSISESAKAEVVAAGGQVHD